MFVTSDILHAKLFDVVDGGTKSNCIGNVSGSRFEACRRRLIDRLLKGDIDDHISAALPGRRVRQRVRFAI